MAAPVFDITKPTATRRTLTVAFESADPGVADPTVSSATVTAQDAQGVDVTASLINAASVVTSTNRVQFQVRNGTHGLAYVIKIAATLSNGDVEVAEGILRVSDLDV